MITVDAHRFLFPGRFDQDIIGFPFLHLVVWTSVRQKANLCYNVGKSSRLLFSVLEKIAHSSGQGNRPQDRRFAWAKKKWACELPQGASRITEVREA